MSLSSKYSRFFSLSERGRLRSLPRSSSSSLRKSSILLLWEEWEVGRLGADGMVFVFWGLGGCGEEACYGKWLEGYFYLFYMELIWFILKLEIVW